MQQPAGPAPGRMIQESVPGKQVTLAHMIVSTRA